MSGHTRRQQQQQQQHQRAYQTRGQQQHYHQHQQPPQQPRIVSSSNGSSIHRQHHHQQSSSHQARSRAASCSLSICYSYLIAIFSSFLVVLGIYLSLTKFNARFLYLSLLGLLIEALGACLYCMSNIHKSKLAQYKQTVDDFNLESNAGTTPPSAPIPSGSQRPSLLRHQQARTVTNILSNRTLNQTATASDNNNSCNNGNNSPANHIDEQLNSCEAQPSDDNLTSNRETGGSQRDNLADNQSVATNSSTGALLHQDNLRRPDGSAIVAAATNNNNKTNNIHEQLPNSDQGTCRDTANILTNIPATSQLPKLPEPEQSQQQHPHQDNINHAGSLSEPSPQSGNAAQFSHEFPSTSAKPSSAIDETDLMSERPMAPPNSMLGPILGQATDVSPQVAKRNPLTPTSPQDSPAAGASGRNRGSRHSNVRRTLVMGLSGEEEVIEIDEEDLDNMSILPPSYESIVTADGRNEQAQKHS